MNDNHGSQAKGSALIMSIILSSGMLVVAVEVSMFVASTIQQARSIDHTLVAQYAAESGVENALHQIRKEGRTVLRDDTKTSPALYHVDGRDAVWSFLPSGATTGDPDRTKFSTTVHAITKTWLSEQQSIDIHLWLNDQGQFTPQDAGMDTMKIMWKKAECASDEAPWIETTALALSIVGNQIQWSDTKGLKKDFQRPSGETSEVSVSLTPFLTDGGNSLTLRIKPFFCSLRGIRITFPKAGSPGDLIEIPNYTLIAPSATFGASTVKLPVIMPRMQGATGIFDYLLFSEEQVEKIEK